MAISGVGPGAAGASVSAVGGLATDATVAGFGRAGRFAGTGLGGVGAGAISAAATAAGGASGGTAGAARSVAVITGAGVILVGAMLPNPSLAIDSTIQCSSTDAPSRAIQRSGRAGAGSGECEEIAWLSIDIV